MAEDNQIKSMFLEADDEITGVIERLKNTQDTEINLVIPKDALLLQSIVNVRLLKRAADSLHKTITIETSDEVGAQVARSAGILTNGAFETLSTLEAAAAATAAETIRETGEPEDAAEIFGPSEAEPDQTDFAAAAPLVEGAKKPFELTIPFLKLDWKYIAGGLALIAIIAFVIFVNTVPTAAITVNPSVANKAASASIKIVTIVQDSPSAASGNVAGTQASAAKEKTAQFAATGSRDEGVKATGKIKITNNTSGQVSLPKGTKLTLKNSTKNYLLDSDVSVPGSGGTAPNVGITAENIGDEYNVSSLNQTFLVPTYSEGQLSGKNDTAAISGGTKKTVAFPTQPDIDTHTQELVDQLTPDVENDLKSKLPNGKFVDGSQAKKTDAKATPAVNVTAANGQFSLDVTYTETALVFNENDVKQILEGTIAKGLPSGQTTYGVVGNVNYVITTPLTNGEIALTASAQVAVGASFDTETIKAAVAGKDINGARKYLSELAGVANFSIDTNPGWYRSIPKDGKRVTVKVVPSSG